MGSGRANFEQPKAGQPLEEEVLEEGKPERKRDIFLTVRMKMMRVYGRFGY